MSEYVYLNGEIVAADEARVSVFDAGFSHAAGLFETMRAYGGRVMRLPEHIHRMQHSAAVLHMQMGITVEEAADGIMKVLAANELKDARIRLVATPGVVPRPGRPDTPSSRTLLISATQVHPYPAELYRNGMRVCISSYRQNRLDPIAGHKTLAYLPRLMAMKEAAERQSQEALWFTTDHLLAEGSVCNVFVVKDGALWTPPLDTPILPGTTRNSVIELARTDGLALEERAIDIDALLSANEIFLTGSVLEVMPVTSIEKHMVGNGAPGLVTGRIRELYASLISRECGIG